MNLKEIKKSAEDCAKEACENKSGYKRRSIMAITIALFYAMVAIRLFQHHNILDIASGITISLFSIVMIVGIFLDKERSNKSFIEWMDIRSRYLDLAKKHEEFGLD